VVVGFIRLQTHGYRRLRSFDLALAPLNILIGANGVGKSSVLEVVDLAAASADGALENTISEAGGISSMLTLDGRTNALRLALGIRRRADRI
jgi:predicted ATPase